MGGRITLPRCVFSLSVGTSTTSAPSASRRTATSTTTGRRLPSPSCTDDGPRIVGGRDDLAGGTWLAVNEHGVVAGLTNRPVPGGPDRTKKSRGELPLVIARHSTAAAGVADFTRSVRPAEYNQAFLLAADRESLFYLELGADGTLLTRELGPGVHVLENVSLDTRSPKVDAVREDIAAASTNGRSLWSSYPHLLARHQVAWFEPIHNSSAPEGARDPATFAACVHTENYGTRSSTMVRVPPSADDRPEVWVADGPPCNTAFVDASPLWARGATTHANGESGPFDRDANDHAGDTTQVVRRWQGDCAPPEWAAAGRPRQNQFPVITIQRTPNRSWHGPQ